MAAWLAVCDHLRNIRTIRKTGWAGLDCAAGFVGWLSAWLTGLTGLAGLEKRLVVAVVDGPVKMENTFSCNASLFRKLPNMSHCFIICIG